MIVVSLRIGQTYQLSYTREFDEVRIALPHGSPGAGQLVLTVEQFEMWSRKV
jgi:hypothetical protein